ncbi:putative major facilitator superfamily transporter [Venturia nashicola]|nr:putative major facilitator superfamily transporter [Venturia nashicola]
MLSTRSSLDQKLQIHHETFSGLKWLLVVLALNSATFLWGLDGTIVVDIQATFVERFNSINKLAWNSAAFFLGAAATVLSWGQAYSHPNAKWVFCISITRFEIGSLFAVRHLAKIS